jgi:hypothetical protein
VLGAAGATRGHLLEGHQSATVQDGVGLRAENLLASTSETPKRRHAALITGPLNA